jgi:hypothetical protein
LPEWAVTNTVCIGWICKLSWKNRKKLRTSKKCVPLCSNALPFVNSPHTLQVAQSKGSQAQGIGQEVFCSQSQVAGWQSQLV